MISFASGTLPGALSAIVACHLTLCPACVQDIRRLDLVGGVMLDEIQAGPVDETSMQRAKSRRLSGQLGRHAAPDSALLARLLLGTPIEGAAARWDQSAPGLQQHRILLSHGAEEIRLVRLLPGQELLHEEEEALALVLQGHFIDDAGQGYRRGDFVEWPESRRLRTAGGGECICLISVSAIQSIPASQSSLQWASIRRARQRVGYAWDRSTALAASVALLIGLGLGLLAGIREDVDAIASLVAQDGNRIWALGALRDVLDRLPSGEDRTLPLDSQMTRFSIRITFQDQGGEYCRQYRVTSSASQMYSGIACHTNGGWAVRAHALIPMEASDSSTAPANGAGGAMEAVVGAWISGDAIVGRDEKAVIGRGWSP
jgi:putative transcriptional regulator